jgi:hypothetical protein
MDYVLKAETGLINFSPAGFRLVARDLRRCAEQFTRSTFSIVPYFLYCRAIELGLKAQLLESRRQSDVKRDFGHDLAAGYDALPAEKRILSLDDAAFLAHVNTLYMRKAFEYVQPGDAANGFSTFPDLDQLARLSAYFASCGGGGSDWPRRGSFMNG